MLRHTRQALLPAIRRRAVLATVCVLVALRLTKCYAVRGSHSDTDDVRAIAGLLTVTCRIALTKLDLCMLSLLHGCGWIKESREFQTKSTYLSIFFILLSLLQNSGAECY